MGKRIVRSWDVFDTLISRRCVNPIGIFELMESVLGDGFSAERVRAENSVRVTKNEISLVDIYNELQVSYGWSAEQKAYAMALEIKFELENVIPISKNMSRVRDGDIAVSDMYLPPEIIMDLLRTAGLKKDIKVYVSNGGKADGSMWRLLKREFIIILHTGDNPHSDFLRPLRHGIPAYWAEASVETSWERVLKCNGAPALSAYVREMRLRKAGCRASLRSLQNAQIEANFPLLLLASAALVSWCSANGVSRALMSSRDCVLWAQIAEKVSRFAKSALEVEYFLTSRVAALKSTDSFLKYAVSRIIPSSVVVDLSMTGVSLAGLADRLGLTEVNAFVIAWERSFASALYGDSFRPKARVRAEYLTAGVIKEDMEAINQSLTPSVHDVSENGDQLVVKYGADNRSQAVLDAVRLQNEIFYEMLDGVPDTVLAEALQIAAGPRLVFLVRESARHAGSFKTIISKANPGAALRKDPNGIILNLPYATRNWVSVWPFSMFKSVMVSVTPPGSLLHRTGRIVNLFLQKLNNRSKRFSA